MSKHSRRTEVFQIRLSIQDKLMLERLTNPRKPMAEVIRSLIKKAYLQEQE